MKQMFDISEQLIMEQSDEIFGVSQISWESSPWKQLSLVNDEIVISLSHAKVYVFSEPVLCLGKVNQNPTSNTAWEENSSWFKDSSQYRTVDTIDGEPMEFEWNIFPEFTTLQLVQEVHKFTNKMGEPITIPGTNYLHVDVQWHHKLLTPHLWLYLQKDFQWDVGHSSDLDQKQSGILLTSTDHEENGTESLNWWWSSSEKADTQVSEPRVQCPEERLWAKEVENYQYTSVPMEIRLKMCFAQLFLLTAQYLRSSLTVVWWIQCLSSKNGETHAGKTIWPIVRASKTVDDNTYTFDWSSCTRKFIAKVQRTSGKAPQQDRLLKFCIDTGFLKCCNCRVLNLVSTCFVFFGSLSHCCCHDVPCGNDWTDSFSVEEIRVFQACLMENPSVQVVCFENNAEWKFCLAPFVCRALLAHWRLVGAVTLGWRSGARALCPFLWFLLV